MVDRMPELPQLFKLFYIYELLSLAVGHEASISARDWIYRAMNPVSKGAIQSSFVLPRHHTNSSIKTREKPLGHGNDLEKAMPSLEEIAGTDSWNASTLSNLLPWEIDELRLEARLQELDALPPGDKDELPWPHGSVDFDRAIGIDQSFYAQDPDERCRRLARPKLMREVPNLKRPIALLLTGQLRSAATTAQWFEENLIRATSNEVHVFVHAWSLKGSRKSFDERNLNDESDGSLAEARVSRMPGLKAFALEAQEDFVEIYKVWYDARYGEGWSGSQSAYRFLSQWYKLSVGHGMLRRWCKGDPREPNTVVWAEPKPQDLYGAQKWFKPPLAIVRLRPDHLLHVRWNLTRAAAEFMARRPTRASGGTFLAVWGPQSRLICSDRLCPDTFNEKRSALACFGQHTIDDQFAFGIPEAFDAYAAPYHPYSRAGTLFSYIVCINWPLVSSNFTIICSCGALCHQDARVGGFG